jgi:1-deoxy-D-xylulose-5-phosphate synthase
MMIDKITSPADLKRLAAGELATLAEELRTIIIECVSKNGGHLASNLGVVELTIALHYVFASPHDKIIWDVGHQAYSHKLLTGRYGRFDTLRKRGGLSGFPKRSESEHDAFGTGHSSTSISAALGIAEARDRRGEDYKVIAVIGDGALSGGLAYEGLNQAGHRKKDLLVILNDNEMSISPNVGAMAAYLSRVLTGSFFNRFKKDTKAFIENIPRIGESVAKIAEKAEGSIKGFLLPGGLFEDLGFNYLGPIDGHDLPLLTDTLTSIRAISGPVLLHIVTKKGKGYKFSEDDPCVFHGIGPFEIDTGETDADKQSAGPDACPSFSEGFGKVLVDAACRDERIVAITAAMKEGTGLTAFAERFPGRFYDVGIAEQHAVTFAAGLASQGVRPVVAIYSTFLQRAYDQIIHDVCLQNLPVVFAIDRGGFVGEDGPTHHGVFDISFLRTVPNLTIMAPRDLAELRSMLALALRHDGPSAIRFPRGRAVVGGPPSSVELMQGKAELLAEGKDLVIIAAGTVAYSALAAAQLLAAEGIRAAVVNARFIKPLDRDLILELAGTTGRIITVEENALAGGFGSAVLELLNDAGLTGVTVKRLGVADAFVEQGSQKALRELCGIDDQGIARAARELFR